MSNMQQLLRFKLWKKKTQTTHIPQNKIYLSPPIAIENNGEKIKQLKL